MQLLKLRKFWLLLGTILLVPDYMMFMVLAQGLAASMTFLPPMAELALWMMAVYPAVLATSAISSYIDFRNGGGSASILAIPIAYAGLFLVVFGVTVVTWEML